MVGDSSVDKSPTMADSTPGDIEFICMVQEVCYNCDLSKQNKTPEI